MDRCISAPGKLFLSGEYAVLWGGAALIAAVGPRLSGAVRARTDLDIHLTTASGRLRGQAGPSGIAWREPVSAPFLFAARGVEEALRASGPPALGFELFVAPPRRAPSGGKLGFGGSAQAALLCVELSRMALGGTFDPLQIALRAHFKAQARGGSGGDVAAIHAGGIVHYRRYGVDPPQIDLRQVSVPRLRLGFAYSGKSTATAAQIQRVEEKLTAGERQRVKEESDQLGRALEDAMVREDFPSLVLIVQNLQRLLRTLGALETEGIRQIISVARSYGAAAKISGAGGGDGCVLFLPDEESERRVLAALGSRGFWATSLAVESGLRGEVQLDEALRALIGG